MIVPLSAQRRFDRRSGSAQLGQQLAARRLLRRALQAGADIVTVPPKFFRQMTQHPKTDEAVGQFLGDFQKWLS